jgi:hypothetical protein
VKVDGLANYGPLLASADSFAWSYGGRRDGLCPHGVVKHEANCPQRAREWRDRIVAQLDIAAARPRQGDLFAGMYAEVTR